ncbi:hypothetical protein R1flu_011302 [Riccia fluitans]|uniref:DUF599 domain-containing protein n=1 Tax=Riccia fluitans TaxID=41844 RepID=A0ABD1Z877_9MARC
MAWNTNYLDLTLSPAAFLLMMAYNVHLYMRYKRNPMSTIMGVNNRARRAWVRSIIQDNDKKNILAVQTLRNSIMGSTLLATTTILLSSAVAAFLASSYEVKEKINSATLGSKSAVSLTLKYMGLLAGFLTAFLCYVQSIRYTNHVNFNINLPEYKGEMTADYVADILERASNFHTAGTRAFYMTIPMLMWIFGPVPLFVSTVVLVPIWYHLDSPLIPRSSYVVSDDQEKNLESLRDDNGSCLDNISLSQSTSFMSKHESNHCPLPVCTML